MKLELYFSPDYIYTIWLVASRHPFEKCDLVSWDDDIPDGKKQ